MRSARFGLLAAAAIALASIAVYAAFWKAGASAMRQTIAGAAEGRGPVSVRAASFKTKGFPFFLRGDLADAQIRGGGVDWRTDRLWIDALPINPARFVFTPSPRQTLDLGRYGRFDVSMEGGRASYATRPAGVWVVDAQADKAAASDPTGARKASAAGVLLKAAPEGDGRHASLFAGSFSWTENGRTATGEKLLVDLVSGVAAEGPTLTVRRFRMETAGATIECDGVITLDAEGFPRGALQATIVNPKGFVRFLFDLGAIRPEEARRAEPALALAAIAAGGALKAPIELADGEARIAGVKIAKTPRLK
ncbi:MAG: DUF2125 domain-containing protein [Parvularculaceae bacterium]|nr:DUF2125 domain-containing protein [Parvularculaceae bacterium]